MKKVAQVWEDIGLVYFFENKNLIGITDLKKCDLELARKNGWEIRRKK